jgi:hypothetical protein
MRSRILTPFVITPLVAIAALALVARQGWSQTSDPHGGHGPAPAAAKNQEVSFPTSCSAQIQPQFNHAVWLLHSFWYEEPLKAFTAITEAEPSCVMGYWGTLSRLGRRWMRRTATTVAVIERRVAATSVSRPSRLTAEIQDRPARRSMLEEQEVDLIE